MTSPVGMACSGPSSWLPLTPTAWTEVWYVADPSATTIISNFDGVVDMAPALVDPGHAFLIDTVGFNKPLIFESGPVNGIWDPGETWHFIIDDYMNFFGAPASAFDSIGVASASAGSPPSSGSIIAIPEPASLAMLALGGALGLLRRRQ